MSSLPISVRLALWVTAAHRDHARTAVEAGALLTAIRAAAVEVDTPDPPTSILRSWVELGDRVVLVALPRAGDLTGLPRGPAAFTAAAVETGECVYAPALGAALVPRLHRYGTALDPGLQVRWDAYDCDPVPSYRLEALTIREIETRFTDELGAAVADLESVEAPVWPSVHAGPAAADAGGWGLPPGVPARSLAVIVRAATLGQIAQDALTSLDASTAAAGLARRDAALRRLVGAADTALADATCVAALSIAGLRPGRPD